jgi:hypothetical protein
MCFCLLDLRLREAGYKKAYAENEYNTAFHVDVLG